MTIYEKEYMEFENHFSQYKDKKIVLYGTGRHTATILPYLSKEWNIVGLMDRNPEYMGQKLFGLPVLHRNEVRSQADLIIINTAGAYWQIIYQRIEDLGLPVYYRNGQKAIKDVDDYTNIKYWNMTKEKLLAEIDRHEVVSFDFYDTLFQRRVYLPTDVFGMVAKCLPKNEQSDYIQIRRSIGFYIDDSNASLEIIYDAIQERLHWSKKKTEAVRAKEMEIERKLLMPRKDIAEAAQYAFDAGKDVYIISDMYLPIDFYITIFARYHIPVKASNIWISCEKKVSKEDETMWELYKAHIGNKAALHIGDHLKDDIQNAKLYHIDTFYCMNKNDLIKYSSIHNILPLSCSGYHMMILGLCASRLFNMAFGLGKTAGKIKFADRNDFGYVVLGPIICTFVLWLRNHVLEDCVKYLFFLGRDGYFLQEDFEYMNQLLDESSVAVSYLETSRQILMCANLESYEDFMEYLKFPYRGNVCNYMADRFGVALSEDKIREYGNRQINAAQDYEELYNLLHPYENKVKENLIKSKENYRQYLCDCGLMNQTLVKHSAVVDLGYYGTNQYLLSRVIGQSIRGYYVMADLTEHNKNCQRNKMAACACDETTKNAQNMNIGIKDLVMESFLTSPRGMIKSMPGKKVFCYDEGKSNQKFFQDKREINEGVREFIRDMVKYYADELQNIKTIKIDSFVDEWYGVCLDNCIIDENIKRSFYNDNAFIHRGEEKVME